MNSKRRAELQRRLSLNAVPRPPAGLADRIKADIPKFLQPEAEPYTRSIALNMRLAAAVLLLVSTALVAVQLMTPSAEEPLQATATAAAPNVAPSAKMAQVAKEEVRGEMRSAGRVQLAEADEAQTLSQAPAPSGLAVPRQIARMNVPSPAEVPANLGYGFEAMQETAVAGRAAEGVDAGPSAAMRHRDAERNEAAMADASALRGQPAPAPAAPAPPAASETITITAEAPMSEPAPRQAATVSRAAAPARFAGAESEAKKALGAAGEVLGISVDPAVFHRLKETIEAGQRPAAASVDIEALVNYFAGAPAKAPRRGLRLEVEASPAPIDTDGENAVLRFTIDTPVRSVAPGASAPQVARNVRLRIDANRDVVSSIQRIGDSDAIGEEAVLHANLSITGLYAIELKRPLRANERVATVRLEYAFADDGRTDTIERVIHGHDLARSWSRASRRHRLASLGALWGQSLKGAATGVDVARRAGELADQNPKDARARELATAASATPGER